MKYPTIGGQFPYIRATPEGDIIEGVGVVKSIFLDARNRLMVGVIDIVDGKHWNVDYIGVNYGKDTKDKYELVINEVIRISKEGNNLVKETVNRYNDEVEALYSKVLGSPIDIKAPENTTEH